MTNLFSTKKVLSVLLLSRHHRGGSGILTHGKRQPARSGDKSRQRQR